MSASVYNSNTADHSRPFLKHFLKVTENVTKRPSIAHRLLSKASSQPAFYTPSDEHGTSNGPFKEDSSLQRALSGSMLVRRSVQRQRIVSPATRRQRQLALVIQPRQFLHGVLAKSAGGPLLSPLPGLLRTVLFEDMM